MAKGIFTHLANEDMLDEIALPNTDNSNIKEDEIESLIGTKLSEVEERHSEQDKQEANKRLKDTAIVLEDLALIARTAEDTKEPLNRELVEIVSRMAVAGTNTDPSVLLPRDATSEDILNKSRQISELVISN